MNIIAKDVFGLDTAKDLQILIGILSRITLHLKKMRPRMYDDPTYVIQFGHPAGGGVCANCKLEVSKKLPVSKEFEEATGLKGEVKVTEASIRLELNDWRNATDDQVQAEAVRVSGLMG